VPGDVVVVTTGVNIPADLVVYKANELKVNNASLTGESEDIQLDPSKEPNDNILETRNVCFFGTSCTAGDGVGICIKTGDDTFIGQIANLASTATSAEKTTLQAELDKFIGIIGKIAITEGIVFFILGCIIGYDMVKNFTFSIGIIVANIPEGLIATVTVSLGLAASILADNFVLVKNM
jgi:magnesium-transporting ATPase (P-type)